MDNNQLKILVGKAFDNRSEDVLKDLINILIKHHGFESRKEAQNYLAQKVSYSINININD